MNLTLIELVKTFPAEQTDQQILDVLSAKSIEVIDSTRYSFREMVRRFGAGPTNAILAKLEEAAQSSALLRITHSALAGDGIDFSDPLTQSQIEELKTAGVFSEAEAKTLSEIGRRTVSQLDQAGLTEITLADITQARRDERYRQNIKERIRNAYNGAIVLAEAGELTRAQWEAFNDDVLEGFDSLE